ncbi:hypothetical protein CK224_08315 [Mesorhizobium sp. WSM3862]|nr:hypothetical protein CK224_08315 [Mesorhizobium sp. WSM3862]
MLLAVFVQEFGQDVELGGICLKRHLMTDHDLTPEQYRAKWNLPADYPMVAPNYAERRSALAKALGFQHKAAAKPAKKASGA